ncbi:hypothetical protein DFH11DRAFT_696516 [Phellopilus nigrolimitatus]|nr:hypothetical protein DFH11DRAFT_696516 [Phellopilus nigrolimitatus]
MSRHPSPGPSISSQGHGHYRHMDVHDSPIGPPGSQPYAASIHGAPPPPVTAQSGPPVATSSATRTKSRAYQSGIAAGAEDVKYAAKYRDLKRKVKEIESVSNFSCLLLLASNVYSIK